MLDFIVFSLALSYVSWALLIYNAGPFTNELKSVFYIDGEDRAVGIIDYVRRLFGVYSIHRPYENADVDKEMKAIEQWVVSPRMHVFNCAYCISLYAQVLIWPLHLLNGGQFNFLWAVAAPMVSGLIHSLKEWLELR